MLNKACGVRFFAQANRELSIRGKREGEKVEYRIKNPIRSIKIQKKLEAKRNIDTLDTASKVRANVRNPKRGLSHVDGNMLRGQAIKLPCPTNHPGGARRYRVCDATNYTRVYYLRATRDGSSAAAGSFNCRPTSELVGLQRGFTQGVRESSDPLMNKFPASLLILARTGNGRLIKLGHDGVRGAERSTSLIFFRPRTDLSADIALRRQQKPSSDSITVFRKNVVDKK